MMLVEKEAQRLCDGIYDKIQFLGQMQCPLNQYGRGLTAVIYKKLLYLEAYYDNMGELFRSLPLVSVKPLQSRISSLSSKLEDKCVQDVIEKLTCDELNDESDASDIDDD